MLRVDTRYCMYWFLNHLYKWTHKHPHNIVNEYTLVYRPIYINKLSTFGKIYHTVNHLRSFLSPGHLVTQSLGHSVTLSSCHPSCQPVRLSVFNIANGWTD